MPDSSTILLVDDEDSIQKLLAYPLEREGFRVLQARDGEDVLRPRGVELELLPEMPDVDVDCPGLSVVGATPERLEQHPAAVDPSRMRGENPQQLELDVRQLHLLAPHLD